MSGVYRREIVTLPLCASTKWKLLSQGMRSIGNLEPCSSQRLINDLGLEPSEATEILRMLHQGNLETLSANELLNLEGQRWKIPTMCERLDEFLGGGISLGRVTEFCGAPGLGKTQFGMQLCVTVAVPHTLGDIPATAVYIDAEGSFSPDRIVDLHRGVKNHLLDHQQQIGHPPHPSLMEWTSDDVLSGIYVYRIKNHIEQLAVCEMLPSLLVEHPEIRLIVVDSVSVHFRQGFEDMSLRTRTLNRMAQRMMSLAESHSLAVVYVNQVTNRIYDNNESEMVPCLGDSWSQCAHMQIRLYWQDAVRYAGIYKSTQLEQKSFSYVITQDGIQ